MTGRGLPRARTGHGHARVTNVELFFDLVFVYAVTQLSHSLLHALTFAGAVNAVLIVIAVWETVSLRVRGPAKAETLTPP